MVDYLGLGIFLVGLVLVVLELTQPGYYIGVGGTVGVVVGLVQMTWPQFLTSWWSPFVVSAVAIVATFASILFYRRFAPPAKAPETLASDALLGKTGRVVTEVQPDSTLGKVKVGGIVWSADASERIPEGTEVIVEQVIGVHLFVRPLPPPAPPPPPTGEPA